MNGISKALGISVLNLLIIGGGNAMDCPKLLDGKSSSRLIPALPPRSAPSKTNISQRLIPMLPPRPVSVEITRLNEIRNFFKTRKNLHTSMMTNSEEIVYLGVLSKIPSLRRCFSTYNVFERNGLKRFLVLNLKNVGMHEFDKIMNTTMNKLEQKLPDSQEEISRRQASMRNFQLKVLNNTAQLVR